MINLTKKYRTKNGYRVVGLILDETRSSYPIRGNIIDSDGDFIESNTGWTKDGVYDIFSGTGSYDLVEEEPVEPTPEPKKDWPQFDPTKQYKTRDGRPFRYYASDGGDSYPIHGAAWNEDIRRWVPYSWTANGRIFPGDLDSDHDLIEVKPRIKREYWLNLYEEVDDVFGYITKERADEGSCGDRIACVRVVVDCEHGEGLDNGD